MAQFVLELNDFDESGKDYSFPIESSWLEEALTGCEVHANTAAPEGAMNVHAQKSGHDVLVRGHIKAGLKLECYRCLGDALLNVDTDFATLFSPRASARMSANDNGEDRDPNEEDRDTYTGDRIALDELVREQLLLEVPMQLLCKEDCAGIPLPDSVKAPTDFGREAIDPRLAPLMNISLKQKTQKE